MKPKKNSPTRLKQSKITAFCSTADSRENRKRKNAEEISEVHKTPVKRSARSPDLFQISPTGKNPKVSDGKNDFDVFGFDDFENDPFLSPRKRESPKKNVLTESQPKNEKWTEEKSEINFESSVKCKVLKATFLTGGNYEQVLLLEDVKLKKRGVCRLRDVWTSFAFSVDDVVSVEAKTLDGHWIVDNKTGHVILYPEMTVSTTTLTKSMFCMRQGILSNYFKDVDSEGSNRMLLGRLVHELFQESLKTTVDSNEDLQKIIEESLRCQNNLHDFYFSNLNVRDIEREAKNFIPRIRKFLEVYVKRKESPTGKNFEGSIDDVVDIEELIKSPSLGLQGRIDVTVKINSKRGKRTVPMELKTGRASFSKEHRSQLVMYILLMNELGRNVESGLLLYLREDILEEVLPQRDETRNLFLLRNHFVDINRRFGEGVLPEPIRNVKFCERCSHFRICSAYLRGEEEGEKLSESHPIRNLDVPDVKRSHVDYFVGWKKMLCLEYEEVFREMGDEWEVSKLTLEPSVERLKEEFKWRFRKGEEESAWGERVFRPGTFVHVMDGRGCRVCTGRVLDVTDSHISLATEKPPDKFSDVYKLIVFKSKFLSIYLSNLGWLLNEEYKNLRELIIEKKSPGFEKNIDRKEFREKCLRHLVNLNKQQRKAVLKSLLCQDYLLIKGPPGTGKTQTILSLIKILLALNKTVLIASHTHSSIDNILLRLEGVEFLRLGSLKSVRKEIHKNCYNFLADNCKTVEDVGKLFDRKLIASTCLGLDADFVRKMKLDYCIVDESSQVLQPEVLRALFCCRKFVLVGDEDQLPPIVRNPEAKKLGMDKSLFERLRGEQSTVRLNLQYRMNSVINSLANAIAYGGSIECGSEEVAKATMEFPNREIYLREDEWVVRVLSDDLENSVVFVDTSNCFNSVSWKTSGERSSVLEANIIVKLIGCLIKFGMKEESVGVIAPFWDQITLLKGKLEKNNFDDIELNTVEQYQGRDKDVILFSCSKENLAEKEVSESELLNDERRLTVAVTRAKHKLILIGDRRTVARYKPFQKLIESMKEPQFYCLSNGRGNFFLENFLT